MAIQNQGLVIGSMATAAREHAQAIVAMAATDNEKLKMEKIKQYKELLMIDTSSFNEAQKKTMKICWTSYLMQIRLHMAVI